MSIEAYEELTSRFELAARLRTNGRYCHRQYKTLPAGQIGAVAADELSGSYHFYRTRYYAGCGLHRIFPSKILLPQIIC